MFIDHHIQPLLVRIAELIQIAVVELTRLMRVAQGIRDVHAQRRGVPRVGIRLLREIENSHELGPSQLWIAAGDGSVSASRRPANSAIMLTSSPGFSISG